MAVETLRPCTAAGAALRSRSARHRVQSWRRGCTGKPFLGLTCRLTPTFFKHAMVRKSSDAEAAGSPSFVRREIASATAGPGQTFPSQNGGGEKSKSVPLKPDPAVEPSQVVEAQLKALRERDLQTVYEFASPANKSHTGPLQRFTQMLEGRAYNLMLGHSDAQVLSSMTVSPNRFQQRIMITGANGRRAAFSWSLSKQDEGPYEGCWMTDTVRRDE